MLGVSWFLKRLWWFYLDCLEIGRWSGSVHWLLAAPGASWGNDCSFPFLAKIIKICRAWKPGAEYAFLYGPRPKLSGNALENENMKSNCVWPQKQGLRVDSISRSAPEAPGNGVGSDALVLRSNTLSKIYATLLFSPNQSSFHQQSTQNFQGLTAYQHPDHPKLILHSAPTSNQFITSENSLPSTTTMQWKAIYFWLPKTPDYRPQHKQPKP